MSFVNAQEMICTARKEGYAVPAFNAENFEMIQAIISAAEKESSPVIIQTTPPTARYLTLHGTVAMVRAMALRTTVPVALHLDHCNSPEDVIAAMKEGYTSVMYDGSRMPYEENAEDTHRLALLAHDFGVSIEAELGATEANAGTPAYTDVETARKFAAYTGVDCLAAAIGTTHGVYKGKPQLDFDRIADISNAVDIPLVLHGVTGISDEQIKKCISLGIAKINVATELRDAMTRAVRAALQDEKIIDPKKFMSTGRDAVEAICIEKIRVCGSSGKAIHNYATVGR